MRLDHANNVWKIGVGDVGSEFDEKRRPLFRGTACLLRALEQGFLFTAMILAAMTSEIIERRFARAAAWSLSAAALAWCGLIHAYAYAPGDTVVALGWGAGASWTAAYVACAGFLLAVPWLTRPHDLEE